MASGEFPLRQGFGIDWPAELLDMAVDKGIINRSGAWYKYKDYSWLGLEGFRQAAISNKELVRRIENELRSE
jgi:recombination protein RecA